MTRFLLALLLLAPAAARAQDYNAPPAIQQMNELPNAGALYLEFCELGHHICSEHRTSCMGQCCDQGEADAEGYGCSGDVFGYIPPFAHYAGWICKPYGKVDSDIALHGDAGPIPKYINQCHNLDH